MSDQEAGASDLSATAVENSFDEDDHLPTVGSGLDYVCDVREGSVISRYFAMARKLSKHIDRLERSSVESFHFEPVLIAVDVGPAVLEKLPTCVGYMRVKAMVLDRNLYIVNLSDSNSRSAGVVNLGYQANLWAQSGIFMVTSGGTMVFGDGNHGRAPDLAVMAIPACRPPGVERCSRIIVELEVSNRSIPSMRRDFTNYFEDPWVVSVIGIKMTRGPGLCAGNRAYAVHWTRTPDGAVVEDVRDFGLLGITGGARREFSRVEADWLPPAPRPLWAGHRYVPLVPEMLDPVPPAGDDRAFALAATRRHLSLFPNMARAGLYNGEPPTIRIPASRVTETLINVPEDPLQDFVLDLGWLFSEVLMSSPTPPAL